METPSLDTLRDIFPTIRELDPEAKIKEEEEFLTRWGKPSKEGNKSLSLAARIAKSKEKAKAKVIPLFPDSQSR